MRDKFKAAASQPRRVEVIDVPGLGAVHVRELMGSEYDEFEAGCVTTIAGKPANRFNRPLLIRLSVCEPDGKPTFAAADDEFLKTLPSSITIPLARKIAEVSGMSTAEADEKN